jgi:chitin disaccharide deacetylase
MKYLIVNADDFGASPGINRGIYETHARGILTSASLLVNTPWSEQAATMAKSLTQLGVGLHADLKGHLSGTVCESQVRAALEQQLQQFLNLTDRLPTHVDSHHNAHRDPRATPVFIEFSREHELPLREHSMVHYFSKFYGHWNGESHFEQISAQNLARMLETEIGEGISELSCHPGYVDHELSSTYRAEREAELDALCSHLVRQTVEREEIELINYHSLARISINVPA